MNALSKFTQLAGARDSGLFSSFWIIFLCFLNRWLKAQPPIYVKHHKLIKKRTSCQPVGVCWRESTERFSWFLKILWSSLIRVTTCYYFLRQVRKTKWRWWAWEKNFVHFKARLLFKECAYSSLFSHLNPTILSSKLSSYSSVFSHLHYSLLGVSWQGIFLTFFSLFFLNELCPDLPRTSSHIRPVRVVYPLLALLFSYHMISPLTGT